MSEHSNNTVPEVEPEIAQAIINHYGNYCEGHRMNLQIRDISHRLLHEELVPPNHPVLNAIVDMHQPLQVKDYPSLVAMFEKLGVHGWPPHDPLIYRTDDEPENSEHPIPEKANPESIETNSDGASVNEDGLSPQEEIEAYVKKLDEEEARNGKGRTTREQTQNRPQQGSESNAKASGKTEVDESDGKPKESKVIRPDKMKSNGQKDDKNKEAKSFVMDPVQASMFKIGSGVNALGSTLKKGIVNPITGVSRRMGRGDLNQWFDTKMDRFESAHSEADSVVTGINNPETSRSEKDQLLSRSKDIFTNYANKVEDLSEFSDKKIGVDRKKKLKEALEKAKQLKDTVEENAEQSPDNKKLLDSIRDALQTIADIFKKIFSRDKESEVESAP